MNKVFKITGIFIINYTIQLLLKIIFAKDKNEHERQIQIRRL